MDQSRFPRILRSEGAARSFRALSVVGMAALSALLLSPPAAFAQLKDPGYTVEQALSVPFAGNLVAAKKAARIAWIERERGRRNVFTAAGPDWAPVRLTNSTEDDGVDLSALAISDDGSTVIYETGHASNLDQQVGNQGHDALGGRRLLWAASTAGGAPRPVMQLTDGAKQGAVLPAVVAVAPAVIAERRGGGRRGGSTMVLAPDGKSALFVAGGQIRQVSIDRAPATAPLMDEVAPYFAALGLNGAPVWSPDGKTIAFVSSRYDQRQLFPTQGGQVTHA